MTAMPPQHPRPRRSAVSNVPESAEDPLRQHAAVDVLGTTISAVTYTDVLERIQSPPTDRAQAFAFCNVHSVMTARQDPAVHRALRTMDVKTPDGMPLVWVLRRRGQPQQPRVYGPDLMEMALPHGVGLGWQHFLFGASDTTLDRLVAKAERLAPGVQIVGRFAPPFRPLTPEEDQRIIEMIRASGASVVWVGLGMPKQELWMARVRDRLPATTLLGVGAAFDLLSGMIPQAPDWIQDRGLEWAYRYLYTNPAFATLIAVDEARRRALSRRDG
jgi:N-acetylglucosaminyldiphosphoundecaprenol N-acetyl-beta-D-mannosaminyltransferase